MKRKSMLWLAIIAFILYLGLLTFYSFPKLEKKLNKSASRSSIKALENSELEWNGRNGYLTVPSDIDKGDAELVKSEIEQIQGVRNVKIIYDESRVKPKEQVKAEEKQEVKAKIKDGKFKLDWKDDDRKLSGEFNKKNADKLHYLFGVKIQKTTQDAAIKDETMEKLEKMGPDLFSNLSQGALEVDGEKIKVSGVAKKDANIDGLKSKWDSLGGVDMKIEMPEVEYKAKKELPKDYKFEYLYFAKGESDLVAESAVDIDEIVDMLNEYKDVKIDIIGHTDNWGKNSANKTLSEQRAKTVMNMLKDKGIDESRMTAYGMGEKEPVADNATALGREKNRRVEIHVKENN